MYTVLDSIETTFEVIILTEARLGSDGVSINDLTSERDKNKNDGVVIYSKNTLN